MKLGWVATLAVFALASCGGQPGGKVHFTGSTPRTALDKDNRGATAQCSLCGTDIEIGAKKCTKAACRASLVWPKEFDCPFCNGTGKCNACTQMGNLFDEKENCWKCYKCKGDGFITFQGKTPQCPACRPREPKCPSCGAKPPGPHETSCKRKGKCQICAGTGQCDFCKGQKKITPDQVKELASKDSRQKEDDTDTKKVEDKKPDDKKQ